MNTNELKDQIVEWIDAKGGVDIEAIDVKGKTLLADIFIIASGNNERQVKAISDHIQTEASKLELRPKGIEGERTARWILLDYYDIVVHIFHKEERAFYNIERLWKEGARPE